MYEIHNAMHMHHSGAFVVPGWVLSMLASLFLLGTCFYVGRLVRPDAVRRHLGHWDWENEIGHAVCMLAMAVMLMPPAFPRVTDSVWSVGLALGAVWFGVRALTWGHAIPGNRVRDDWVHAGMLFGMSLMFRPLDLGVLFTGVQISFWVWFAGFYAWRTSKDARRHGSLRLGSNLAHFAMGTVMVPMTLFPASMMPGHGVQEVSAPVIKLDGISVSRPRAVNDGSVRVVDDGDFTEAVFASEKPVAVLVFGGCEKCADEVRIFSTLAREYVGKRVKFVRVNKDDSPKSCKVLGVKECPRVCVVTQKGISVADEKVDVTDGNELRSFIDRHLE